jgi:adenylate kinase family enzyme
MATDIQVIAFTGLPGTGKSTLAERLGRENGVPVFNGDWLMGALKPAHHVLSELDRPTYLAMYESRIESLITRQLMFGQSAVVDDMLKDDVATRWQKLARSHEARFSLSSAPVQTGPSTATGWKVANAAFPAGTRSDGTTSNACVPNFCH